MYINFVSLLSILAQRLDNQSTNQPETTMKTFSLCMYAGVCILFSCFSSQLQAQTNCDISQDQSQGYNTSISNVTANGDGTHTITIILENNGCSGCKKLNRYSVEANPGTYSDIEVQLLSGNFTYANIDMGPDIGGGITGFKINNTNGMGNGQAASFSVTYTLSGGLQDQQFIAKAGPFNLTASFSAADFQAVLDCLNPGPIDILPYYDPLGVGKINDIIGYELTSLYVASQEGTFIAEDVADIYRVVGETVLISLLTQPGQYGAALSDLTVPAYGLTNAIGDPGTNTIQGLYPINNLLLLNERPDILVSAGPVFPALGNSGLVTSQGDTALRSYIARDVFKVDGTGIKVGVISDSYNTKLGDQASDDIIKGDLPGAANPNFTTPVDLVLEYPYGEASDEGRAMMQIVHDIAPGAELAFRTGFAGPADFAVGISQLRLAGCDVIVDDVTYINEPFFRDGIVAQAVDNAAALGVSYLSAAGNFGTNSWEGNFNPIPSPGALPGDAHNFAPGGSPADVSQNVKLYQGQYTVVMQWDDGTPGLTTSSDFDIYLANNNDIAFFGFNRANINSTPIEVLPFTVVADSTETNFQIIRAATAAGYDTSQPTILKYIVFRGTLIINEYDVLDASTITGQANAEGAMAVGAVLYTNTPEFGEPAPTVASFSSRGSTPVNGSFRAKPEFCAPNVVNTSVDLGGGFDFEGDGFPNFVGTSAAAPHAAGVAALVLQARQKYYDDSLSPLDLKGILQNTALDMYGSGYDLESGAGYILADSALASLANPSAFLITVTYDTTLTPGFEEIPITISGEYIVPGSQVYFNGQLLEIYSAMPGDTTITAVIPTYSDTILFPEIQVNNPSLEGTNGLDGGLSNTVYLTTKTTVFVDIQNVNKVYGETLPEFTANYFLATIEGNEPIETAGLTPEELNRIQGVDLSTIANSLSNVGLWAIEADPNDPLNPLSDVEATDPLDIALLQSYNFVFSNGLMTIDPLEIVIDPKDTTLVYNQEFIGFDFNYFFNDNNDLNISPEDSTAISNGVKLVHGLALVNKPAVLVQGLALVNDAGESLLTEELLQNSNVMVSAAVRLVQGLALVNGSLVNPDAFYESVAFTNANVRLVQGLALVNGLKLVQGLALVNELDANGNIVNSYPLTQGLALVNNSGDLNSSTFNANSNSQTIVILGEGDIEILSGEAEGTVDIESINLVTGETVGSHFILPGAFISNNFVISYLVGELTITPAIASFDFATESLTQVYDGTPKQVQVIADQEDISYTVTYNGDETLPTDAGSYLVEVNVTDINYVGGASTTLVINPATADISFADLNETYDGLGKSISVNTSPPGLNLTITYDGSDALPVNAGTYSVDVIVNDANYVGSISETFVVDPAEAIASADGIYFIDQGAALPEFAVNYSGFVNGEDEMVVSSITFEFSPEYNGDAGTYEVIPMPVAANYTFTTISATFYVNPAGPGTKQLKPVFLCYEELPQPDESGYSFIGYFKYENNNQDNIYIPIGSDNQIFGPASVDNSEQPELFLAGGGSLQMPYDGQSFTWQITSNKNNGSKGAIPANTSNKRCSSGKKSISTSEIAEEVFTVYPNPSSGIVFVQFKEKVKDSVKLQVYDSTGREYDLEIQNNKEMFQIDLSGYATGLYLLKVSTGEVVEVRRLIIY